MILAVGSYVLQRFGVYLIVLVWMYRWGPGVALGIQCGMLGLGVALVVAGAMRARAKSRGE